MQCIALCILISGRVCHNAVVCACGIRRPLSAVGHKNKGREGGVARRDQRSNGKDTSLYATATEGGRDGRWILLWEEAAFLRKSVGDTEEAKAQQAHADP